LPAEDVAHQPQTTWILPDERSGATFLTVLIWLPDLLRSVTTTSSEQTPTRRYGS